MNAETNPRSYQIIISTTFISLLGMPVIGPVLPVLQDVFTINNRDIGWMIMSSYTLPALFFIPFTGYLADRFGKKNILIPSLFLFAVSGSLISLAQNADTVIVLRFIQGLGGSALLTLSPALVPDLFQGQERVKAMGYTGVTQGIGAGLLPMLGGLLASVTWYLPFLTAVIGLPIGLYLIIHLKNVRPGVLPKTGTYIRDAYENLVNKDVLQLCFFTFGYVFIGFGAFISYIPSYMNTTFNTGTILIGIIIATRTISGSICSAVLNKITTRFSSRTLLVFSFVLLMLGMSAVPLTGRIEAVVFLALAYGAGFGIVRPLIQVLLFEISPENLRSTFSSANGTALRIAQTFSPLIAGLVVAGLGFQMLYYLAAGLSFLMVICCLLASPLLSEKAIVEKNN
jgi:ACDE family multidrug resistance protein